MKMMTLEMRRRRAVVRLLIILLAVLTVLAAGTAIYLGNYYHAGGEAMAVLEHPAAGVKAEEVRGDWITFSPAETASDKIPGIIFYPGGKVEYEAYAPLMEMLTEKGYFCVLVHMPGNLAPLDKDAAKDVQKAYPQIDRWVIGGHSLGGAVAADYAADHPQDFEGIFFLGAYSPADLSGSGLKGLTVTGTEDRVLVRKEYEENRVKLPPGTEEVTIPGGNHAGFGCYGPQKGDGEAGISPETQQQKTADAIAAWVPER